MSSWLKWEFHRLIGVRLHIHYKTKLASLHSTCMAMLAINVWILHLIFTPCSSVPLLSVGPCLHLTLGLSPLLTTHFIFMTFLLVKVCILAACSPPDMACHLHPILCTWDAFTTCIPVTFLLRFCSLHPKWKENMYIMVYGSTPYVGMTSKKWQPH